MSNETRGEAIKRRRLAMGGVSQHELARFAKEQGWKVSRDMIMAVEKGTAEEDSYAIVEGLLDHLKVIRDRMEEEGEPEDSGRGSDTVEYEVKGDFGVSIFVRGPVADAKRLEESVTRIIKEMRGK